MEKAACKIKTIDSSQRQFDLLCFDDYYVCPYQLSIAFTMRLYMYKIMILVKRDLLFPEAFKEINHINSGNKRCQQLKI